MLAGAGNASSRPLPQYPPLRPEARSGPSAIACSSARKANPALPSCKPRLTRTHRFLEASLQRCYWCSLQREAHCA